MACKFQDCCSFALEKAKELGVLFKPFENYFENCNINDYLNFEVYEAQIKEIMTMLEQIDSKINKLGHQSRIPPGVFCQFSRFHQ